MEKQTLAPQRVRDRWTILVRPVRGLVRRDARRSVARWQILSFGFNEPEPLARARHSLHRRRRVPAARLLDTMPAAAGSSRLYWLLVLMYIDDE